MNKSRKKPQGFIAIVSLLIVATIAMFLAVGMLLDGVNNASLSLSSIYYENARININTCAQEMLIRIKKENSYSGSVNYALSDNDNCSATIIWFAPQQIAPGIVERLANLDVTGISYGFTRTFRYELRRDRYDVNYSSGALEYFNNIEFISITELTT